MPDHLLIGPTPDRPSVELWSLRRLPFEPEGDLLRMREELRAAVAELGAGAGEVLHAVYASLDRSLADAENVLLYNVGARYLTRAAWNGLRFERSHIVPPAPRDIDFVPKHYQRYSLRARDAGFRCWHRTETLARWDHVPCGRLLAEAKPETAWAALKQGDVEGLAAEHARPFALRLSLTRPKGAAPAPARLVKGLVDGVVAAFETHIGPPETLDLVVSRLATSLAVPPDTIRGWLTGRDMAVLADRHLIRPARTHVAWNPGDDRCLAAELLLDPEPGEWALSGALSAIEPASRRPSP